jgi:hypothetical protein
MRTLQGSIDEVLQGFPEQALSVLIEQKLAACGIKLSPREQALLTKEVLQGSRDTFRIRSWKWWERRKVALDFTSRDFEWIERRFGDFVENSLPALIEAITEEFSRKILANLKRNWPTDSRLQRQDLVGFKKQLYERWKLPLEGLRMLLTMSRELGDSINKEVRQSLDASAHYHLIEVLCRLHARACQIGEEILCLLEGGFADGAMARWRTLHEVAVVASFVATHGEDLAERYVLHQAVESKRAAAEYEKCAPDLGYERLEQDELEAVQKSYDAAIARFGPGFGKGDYGWAVRHLQKPQPSFKDIEQATNNEYLRAHSRMAGHNVHANPKGVFFKLGLLRDSRLLLAGPSNAGLAEPGQCTALSLADTSATLGTLQPTLDNNLAIRMIAQLVHEIAGGFANAEERLAADEASLRPPPEQSTPGT